jgi:hypothetical protein
VADLFDRDLSACGGKRAEELVERNIRSGPFDFDDPRLTRLDSTSELLLRHISCLPLSTDGQRHFDPSVEQLPLLVGHFQEISRVTESPPGGFQRLSLLHVHNWRLQLKSISYLAKQAV